MQGKGIIKFFLVVMLLVTAVQYLFILPTNAVEKDAAEYGEEQSAPVQGEREKAETYKVAVADYLDSMSNKEVFRVPLLKSYTYQDLKSQQLAYGLDLKGGMSVVLQVDLREFIRALASSSKDPTFDEALNKASQAQKNAQDDFVTLFADAWQEVKGDKKLATIFQRNDALRDQIGLTTSDAEVIRILSERSKETVNLTYELLKKRIDQLGVVQPNVSLDAERDLILVELPGIDNPERARNVLQAAAKLEFYDIYRLSEGNIVQSLISADEFLANRKKLDAGADSTDLVKPAEFRYDTTYATDTLGNITDQIVAIDSVEVAPPIEAGPLFSIFQPNNGNLGPAVLGIAQRTEMDDVMEMFNDPEVKRLFPRDLQLNWSATPLPLGEDAVDQEQFYELYMIKVPRDGVAPLSGDYLTDASANPDPTGQIAVNLSMNSEGGRIWSQWTARAAADQNRQVAILLDGEVVSAPSVRVQIDGGNTSITGNFSVQEADDLANILKIGSLPASTEIVQSSIIGPSLGAENISRSMNAFIIGFLLLMAFMLFYYGGGGIVSVIALALNMIFIFGALASIGTVLTLPGIAGILLTIGMAVDANVIIYERIREELRAGKSKAAAVADGFKNSYSAIIDANVTTVLVAAVLAYFGLGPIKGFAIVLIIGVLSSVFTAVLVGRLIIEWWLGRGKDVSFWTAWSKNAFADMNIDWLGKRRVAYIVSTVLVVGSLISILFVRGFDLGVDFKGGYSYTVDFAQDIDAQDVRQALTEPFGNTPTVKAVDGSSTLNIVTDYLINDTEEDAQDRVMEALYTGIKAATGDNSLTLADFSSADIASGTHIVSTSKVGPTIADDIKRSSLIAGSLALILIFLYLLLRFNKWQYSLGAVAALFHDSIIVLGFFSVFWGFLPFNMEVDQAFIAAILTVIGYSINDTVVVFDRIREYLGISSGTKTEIINRAVNSTVSRTIITSLTTFFVVAVLFFLGGTSIRGFAFALMVGILVGTYSSIFVATPIVHDFADDLTPKEVDTTTSSFTASKAKV